MRFALVNNSKVEAAPGLTGSCTACGGLMIAKCGTKRIGHWSHYGERNCDHWWETETEWHRAWKNLFPVKWQEVGQVAINGDRHIADIKTSFGLVIEIQHSSIAETEMNAREDFYKNMIWIMDVTRLKTDYVRLSKNVLQLLSPIAAGYYITSRPEQVFPSAWLNRKVPVVFDHECLQGFSRGMASEQSSLWCLLPGRADGHAVVAHISRRQFAEVAQQRLEIFPSEQILKTIQELSLRRSQQLLPPSGFPKSGRRPRRRYPRFLM